MNPLSVLENSHRLPTTPAFVLDQRRIERNADTLAELAHKSGCKALYSIKALPLTAVLQWIKPYVAGFSASSLFEARLAREIIGTSGSVHLTTPGIRPDEIDELKQCCSHISFNSLMQWQRFSTPPTKASLGLRVNPQLSFTADVRYDPCRQHSKLGVNLQELWLHGLADGVKGLHFHTVFKATDFAPLVQTLKLIQQTLGSAFKTLQWLNFGGGYLSSQIHDPTPFITLVKTLQDSYGLEVYIEPGNALVGNAGYLVSTVIDNFKSDGKHIAVLDTAINHLPEVFEYQVKPEILTLESGGACPVILAGSTCLAGDIFGEYWFKQPLALGARVVFKQVGAYSLIKANRFNGYNLPTIYALSDQDLMQLKAYDFEDYRSQWVS